jgi:transposase-like protein
MTKKKITAKRPAFYPEAFKRQVIEEHLRTGIPKSLLQEKHGICGKSAIFNWMRALGYTPGSARTLILAAKRPIVLEKERTLTGDADDPRQRIEQLERQLEDERLRSEMYLRMIEIAETEYKVPIRKKPGTK